MVIVFCPRCGSTSAGEGASDHLPPGLWLMACGHCGHTANCDEWDIKFDWNTTREVSVVPPFVAPTDRLLTALRTLRGGEAPELFPVVRRVAAAWESALERLSDGLRALEEDEPLREVALWLSVLPVEEGRALLQSIPGIDAASPLPAKRGEVGLSLIHI